MSTGAWAAHAYAQFGDIKYPPGFDHFDYVNPAAPKGGEFSLVAPTRVSTFDKYNPFTLKGNAPAGVGELMFETLLTGTLDEPTTAYGLLAEDVSVAADGLSATFRLQPKARFQNGDPVLAIDVKDSFERLVSKEASPVYRSAFGDIKGVTVIADRTVRFDFKRPNAELPLIAGSVPIFSHKWGLKDGKLTPFDKIILEQPITSGPYRIGAVNFGKDITYERDKSYWAQQLNVRKGQYNFDRITYKIYKDETARLEAFKAGEFDFNQAYSARDWARAFTGAKFAPGGELIKQELEHHNAGGAQSFFFNTRLPKFKDPRVREAIGLAMDFEWMNRQLFFNSYTRVRGYFSGGDFEAKGLPGPDELALLEPLRKKIDPKVFTDPVPPSPSTAPPGSLRANLRKARALLAEAGWTYRDGALRNAKGEAFQFDFLEDIGQASMGRIITPFSQNLRKLGIDTQFKVIDFALLQKRLDVFDFDVAGIALQGSLSPGTELVDLLGSQAADTPGSNNFIGLKDPVVDALLDKVLAARTRPEQIAALRSLDRVLRFGHYLVPMWYSSVHRVSYRAHRFEQPQVKPTYYQAEGWALSTWWATSGRR